MCNSPHLIAVSGALSRFSADPTDVAGRLAAGSRQLSRMTWPSLCTRPCLPWGCVNRGLVRNCKTQRLICTHPCTSPGEPRLSPARRLCQHAWVTAAGYRGGRRTHFVPLWTQTRVERRSKYLDLALDHCYGWRTVTMWRGEGAQQKEPWARRPEAWAPAALSPWHQVVRAQVSLTSSLLLPREVSGPQVCAFVFRGVFLPGYSLCRERIK